MSVKATLSLVCSVLLSVFLINTALASDPVPKSVMTLVPVLQQWGSNPVLVSAVKAQNAKGVSLAEIQRIDKEWINASDVTPLMHSIMENDAAKELKRLESSKPYFDEIFLMDNQGANVAMTNKTSDYWQGDEEKFTESYKSGQGAVHIGKVKFDKSSQAYLVQVSVPVMDGGKAIGAITIGINMDELDKASK